MVTKNVAKIKPEKLEELKLKAHIFDELTELIEERYFAYLMKLTEKERNIPLKKVKKLLK